MKKQKRYSLQDKALIALKKAVKEVVKRHEQSGRPLVIWQDGRVVKISASHILRRAQ